MFICKCHAFISCCCIIVSSSVWRLGAKPLDYHRPPGPTRYAQPLSNYTSTPVRSTPPVPPGCSHMGAPPTAVVAPSQAMSVPAAVYTPGLFSGMTSQSETLPSGGVPLNYAPVTHHWFYAEFIELRLCWKPFSVTDSVELEDAFRAGKYQILLYDISVIIQKTCKKAGSDILNNCYLSGGKCMQTQYFMSTNTQKHRIAIVGTCYNMQTNSLLTL